MEPILTHDPGTYPCSTNGNALINDTTGGLWICDGTGNWIETPPIQGPEGGKGEPGEKGQKGTKGDKLVFADLLPDDLEALKGEKGQKGLKGDKGTKGDKLLFSDLDATDKEALKGQKGEKGGKGEEGGKGEKGVGDKGELGPKGEDGVFPEPNPDGLLYGRSLSVPDPVTGDSNAEWRRSVEHTGDVMLGALTSPTLTTGADADSKAILKMDDGQNAFNGGPHELEARSGSDAATDWDSWVSSTTPQKADAIGTDGSGKWLKVCRTVNATFSSDNGETWTELLNTPSGEWIGVAYGDGRWVIVANGGTNRIASSDDDGETWTTHTTPSVHAWERVRYGQGKFIAVAGAYSGGSDKVGYSEDGITWENKTATSGAEWRDVAYNGTDQWIAVGTFTSMMTSPDGETWTAVTGIPNASWCSIEYGNGFWVCVAYGGSARSMRSEDGVNWEFTNIDDNVSWKGMTYGEGRFVAVSLSNSPAISSSEDGGMSWVTHPAGTSTDAWTDIAYGDGKFIACSRKDGENITALEIQARPGGLYFDDDLIYTSENAAPIFEKIGDISNLVVNNSQEIEVLAPTLVKGTWTYTGTTSTSVGEYTLTPAGNDFATATKLIINPETGGVDFTAELTAIAEMSVLTIQNLLDSNGLSARVSSNTVNASGNFEFDLIEVYASDDPDSVSRDGDAIIKFREGTGGAVPTLKQVTDQGAVTDVNVTLGSLIKMDDGQDAYNGGPHELEARLGADPGLYYDNNLLYSTTEIDPIVNQIDDLSNAVINNAESIEIMAPSVFKGTWDATAGANPGTGDYSVDPETGLFADVTSVLLDPIDGQGVDHTLAFDTIEEGNYFTILNTGNAYGLNGRVSTVTVDANSNYVITLTDVRAVDDPNGGSVAGTAVIKVQRFIDPDNITNINNIIDGLNGNFNNIADQRGVVWINDEISLPAYLPSGNAIPNGKLYFNSRYLQLYIHVGGSWLGLL